jgi:hypothetical protein
MRQAPGTGRTSRTAAVLPRPGRSVGFRPITHARLVDDWRTTLDVFGAALGDEDEDRYFTPAELGQLERKLAADRRWLEHFAAIRSFP